jgi:serine/threonine protein kinase
MLILVLYCLGDNKWKLTDFGISAQVTSRKAMSTSNARGTPSYRAPELLEDHPTFTKMVDIWSLGCVLHELATSRLAFSGDYSVLKYYDNAEKFSDIQINSSSAFLRHHVSEGICDLLHRDPTRRPRASIVGTICSAYIHILNISTLRNLIESQPYPYYSEWKQLIEKGLSEPEWLFSVAEVYEKNGQEELGIPLSQRNGSEVSERCEIKVPIRY